MKNLKSYIENTTEAGCACLITMVQGNVLAITISHLLIATQTGIIAGVIAATTILSFKIKNLWMISLSIGVVTAITDYFVHTGKFGLSVFTEAAVTGAGAALLSFVVHFVISKLQKNKFMQE
jgi:hypothetical protein